MLRIGDEQHTARAGTFAFVPRDTIHGFHNLSTESATLLVMHHPAGFEQFLEEMQKLVARHGNSEEKTARRPPRPGSLARMGARQNDGRDRLRVNPRCLA